MILVTAATGTIGSLVLRELVDADVAVRAAVHRRPVDLAGIETCPIDLDDPDTLPAALDGVRTVFLASYDTLHEQALVGPAVRAGVERIVKLSAWRADEGGFTIGRWHRQVERTIEDSGLAWTFLRPNFFMQNFVNFVGGLIRDEGAIYEPAGDARISYIDARDIGRVAARVLTEPGHEQRAYALSGPDALTHDEIAATLTQTLGRTIRHHRVTDAEYVDKLRAIGFPDQDATAFTDSYRYGRTGTCSAVTPHVTDLTGRSPRSFAQFCQDHAEAFTTIPATDPAASDH